MLTKTRINIPVWLMRSIEDKLDTRMSRDLEIQNVERETPKAALVTVKPVFEAGASNCHRCGKDLTHPVSKVVGFGPDCCIALGLPRPGIDDAEEWLENARETLGNTEWTFWLPKRYLGDVDLGDVETHTPENNRSATVTPDNKIAVNFSYDKNLVSGVKALRDRRFDPVSKTWTVSPSNELKLFLDENDFDYGDDVNILFNNKNLEVKEQPKLIDYNGSKFVVTFKYELLTKNAIKAIKGSRFDKSGPAWTIPANVNSIISLREVADSFGFNFTEKAQQRINELTQTIDGLHALSYATETDFDCGVNDLRKFQHVAVEYVDKAKRVIIGDTMGLGKTVESLASAEYENAFPMLVICPANLKGNWKKEIEKWFPHRSVEVLNGKTGKYNAEITIVNYDILSDGWDGSIDGGVKKAKKIGAFIPTQHTLELSKMPLKMVVMDEGHYIKEKGAQRSRATQYLAAGKASGRAAGSLAAREGVEYRLWLSGTPILNRPKELIFPLMVLDRFEELGGFNHFTYHFCDRKDTRFGMDINGSSNEAELNTLLRSSCYIRRTKRDVLDELPPKEFSDQYISIDNREEYDFAEAELIEYVGERAKRNPEFLSEISNMDLDEQELALEIEELRAEGRAEQAEVLVRLVNLRRLTAEGKLQASLDWIENFLESGESLIVFANHRHVVNAVADRFNAPKIMGSMNLKKIEEGKEAFQAGDEQLIVLNIKAGGVGHTLTAASHVVFVEYPWTPGEMDQAIDRAYARLNDLHGVTVYQLIADNTMDETLMEMIAQKRVVVDAVTDGIASTSSESFISKLMRERG